MKLWDYDIDIHEAIRTIKKKQWKYVLLQLPEGLKNTSEKLVDFIVQQTNASVLVAADPCYGACDIPCIDQIRSLGIDVILHIGHTEIPSMRISKDIPILFLNAKSRKPVIRVATKALSSLIGIHIGLVTTAQHIHTLPDVQAFLRKKRYVPHLGTGDQRISHPGQILGCNFSSAVAISSLVDSYLYIGSGTFHPLGLLLSTHKPVIVADPYTGSILKTELEHLKDQVLRQRYATISKTTMATTFGILVGLKTGQQQMNLALQVQKKLQERCKKAFILTINHITPMILESFPNIDCYVSTLCPRIAIDDHLQYKQTIITPVELSIALGEKSWDDYVFDTIV